MTVQVQHISAHAHKDSGYWQVLKDGKILRKFLGLDARSDAQDYAKYLAVGQQKDNS